MNKKKFVSVRYLLKGLNEIYGNPNEKGISEFERTRRKCSQKQIEKVKKENPNGVIRVKEPKKQNMEDLELQEQWDYKEAEAYEAERSY